MLVNQDTAAIDDFFFEANYVKHTEKLWFTYSDPIRLALKLPSCFTSLKAASEPPGLSQFMASISFATKQKHWNQSQLFWMQNLS